MNNLTIIRTWTATDDCGNTIQAVQTVTVKDTIAPVLSVTPVPDTTVACIGDVPPAAIVSASDNCNFVPVIYYETISDSACVNKVIINRTWIATDDCGNTIQANQVVTVKDTIPPVFFDVPNDTVVSCIDEVPVAPILTASDNCGYIPVDYSETVSDSTCANLLTITRTWSASDDCGNSMSATQIISIIDTVPPVFFDVPNDTVVSCIDEVPVAPILTASDNCGYIPVDYSETVSDSTCANLLTITRTWSASDDCGNSMSATQIISIIDTVPPVFFDVPNDTTISCIDGVPVAPILTASDNCGIIPVDYSEVISDILCENKLTITRIWSASDECGNSFTATQIITVNDTIPPVLSCPPDLFIPVGDAIPDFYLSFANFKIAGGVGTDNCSLDESTFNLISEITNSGSKEDTIIRIYQISDKCGNSGTCEHILIVDTDAGTELSCPPSVVVACFNDIPEPYLILQDFINANGDVASKCSIDSISFTYIGQLSDGKNCPETLSRFYQISDLCGNTVLCTHYVTINDTIPPVINCPPDVTVAVGDPVPDVFSDYISFTTEGGIAADNCGIVESSFKLFDELIADGLVADTVTRIYEIADSCANTATCEQTIIVLNDLELQIICSSESEILVECITDIPLAFADYNDFISGGGFASSKCGIAEETFALLSEISDSNKCPERITRTYVVEDSCGNALTCEHVFVIYDSTPPELTCAPDTTIQPNESAPSAYVSYTEFVLAGGIATDNCGIVEETFALVSEVSDGNEFPEILTRTYEIYDSCGNRAVTCSQQIILEGDAQLNITCPLTVETACFDEVPQPFLNYSEWVDAGGYAFSACGIDINTFALIGVIESTETCPTVITRNYALQDTCGNLLICSHKIIVDDVEPPFMECLDDMELNYTETVPLPFFNFAEFIAAGGNASDNCGLVENSFHLASETFAGADPQTITRIYQIADSCDNIATCIQIIISHKSPDLQISCPPTIVLECSRNLAIPTPFATYTKYVNNGGGFATSFCGIDESSFKWIGDVSDGQHCPEKIVRTYLIKDFCGDSVFCEQLIIINDLAKPVFFIQPTEISCRNNMPDVFRTLNDLFMGGGNVQDLCDNQNQLRNFRFVEEFSDGKKCPETVVRVYEIDDRCGNIGRGYHTIFINDIKPPTIIRGPAAITSVCGVPDVYKNYQQFYDAGGFVLDDCGTPTMQFMGDAADGEDCPKTIRRIYRFTDACGNYSDYTQLITVNDTVSPVIVQSPKDTVTICSPQTIFTYADFVNQGGVSTDDCGLNTSTFRLLNQTVSSELICPKTYTNTYIIEDYCGNSAEFNHTVILVDTIAPQMECPPYGNIEINAKTPAAFATYQEFIAAGGRVTDNCAVDPNTFNFVSIDSTEDICAVTLLYKYEVADFCGNYVECTHEIIKGHIFPPVLTAPLFVNIVCKEDVPASFKTIQEFIIGGGKLFDEDNNVDPGSFELISETTDSVKCPITIVRTYQIKDSCSLIAEAVHVITVSDVELPLISCPPLTSVECLADKSLEFTSIEAFVNAGGIISDNCEIDSSTFKMAYEETFKNDDYIEIRRWYSVADLCGNVNACTHLVRVTDNNPPALVCNDITVYLDNTGKIIISDIEIGEITNGTIDNCTAKEDLIIWIDKLEFNCTAIGNIQTVNIVVTDDAGNYSTCQAKITVLDNIAPQASCNDIEIYLDENGTASIDVSMIDNNSYDVCGIENMFLSAYNFDCTTTGDNIVVLTVVDKAGNVSTCTANVKVLDIISPSAVCKDITVQLDSANNFNLIAIDLDGGSTDNCGIEKYVASYNNFDCSNVGIQTIELTVYDFTGNTSICTVEATILGNTPPVAINDTITTSMNYAAQVNVLANDFDELTIIDTSSFTIVTEPAHGTYIIEPGTGLITYIPDSDFTGTDFMTYSICDNGYPCETMCSTATIYINVNLANIPPVAENDTFSMMCYTLTGGLLYNDYDPDSRIIQIETIPYVAPSKGSVIINEDGTFMYVPDAYYTGLDSFSYIICDKGIPSECDTAKVIVEIIPDNDCDGISDLDDIDDDNDGILDVVEGDKTIDSDGDGIYDSLDIDSDNDGITDNVEGQGEDNYIEPTGYDTDGDGWDDAYDPDNGGIQFVPIDTDEDLIPDYLDADSDGDNVFDYIEGHDINSDGVADVTRFFTDYDHDGLDDAFDIFDNNERPNSPYNETGSNAPLQDFDSDGTRDWRDLNDENDGYPTALEDLNNDGDYSNDDLDLDGHPEYLDMELDCSLFIPEAFSPNGDGVHDFFQIYCIQQYPDAKLLIFNRAGIKLFEKEHYGNLDFWGTDEAAWWWGYSEHRLTIGKGTLPAGNYVY